MRTSSMHAQHIFQSSKNLLIDKSIGKCVASILPATHFTLESLSSALCAIGQVFCLEAVCAVFVRLDRVFSINNTNLLWFEHGEHFD